MLHTSILLFFILVNLPSNVFAAKEQIEYGGTVTSRYRPEVSQLGLTAGSFRIYPNLNFTQQYNDNIFAIDNNKQSDQLFIYTPALTLKSNWSRHSLEVSLNSKIGRYQFLSSENYDDLNFTAKGLLEATRSIKSQFTLSHSKLHEPRDSTDNAGGIQPTQYKLTTANLNLNYQPGRFSITPSIDFQEYQYTNVLSLQSGNLVPLQQDDRNRKEYIIGIQGNYRLGALSEIYIRTRRTIKSYEKLQAFTNFDRSSTGYDFGAGIRYDLGGLTYGHLFYGYSKQNYIQPLPDISTPIFEFSFVWNIYSLTTVELSSIRSLKETTSHSFSGYTSTFTNIKLSHEFARDILFFAEIGEYTSKFEGISSAYRSDKLFRYSTGIKWMINRYINTSLRYEKIKRNSNDTTIAAGLFDGDFKANIIRFTIELKL